MKAYLVSILASAMLAFAAPGEPLECLIECVEPSQHDPKVNFAGRISTVT